MGDNLVLRFQYRGKDTDVVVNNVDKVNLLDLITEYWEICERENTPTPQNPGRELIYIWVNDLPKLTAVVQAAQSLKAMSKTLQSNEPNTEPTHAHVEKQLNPAAHVEKQLKPAALNRESVIPHSPVTQTQDPPTFSAEINTSNTPDSPSHVNNLITDNLEHWENLEITPVVPNRGRGRGKGRLRGIGRGRGRGRGVLGSVHPLTLRRSPSNRVETHSITSFEVGGSSNQAINSPFFKKRIPRTTAKRKGLLAATVSTKKTVAVDLAQDLEESNGLNLDSDHDYNPQLEETDVQVDSEDVSLDDEDDGMEEPEHQPMPLIHDYFDPYEGPVWEDDCEDINNYMAKLYRNEESGFSIVVEKASNWVYTVRCSDERCSWRLHGSKLADGVTWAIKSIIGSEHTCLGLQKTNPMVSTKWAKKVLLEDIRENENIPAKCLNRKLFERFGVQMTKSSLYRMKAQALIEIHGGFNVSYSYLPNYCEVIKSTNPSSVAHCTCNPVEHPERPLSFNCIFISFKGCLDGVVGGCRGLIGVDGTFLKGNYDGILLSTIALDGNNEMFPLAWAVVSCEDERNWKFFIHHLKTLLQNTERGDNWCIISDRHKVSLVYFHLILISFQSTLLIYVNLSIAHTGIEKACTDLWPNVGRRFCCKHLSVNFKNVFAGPKMWQFFWLATSATSPFTFGKAMKQIQKNKDAARIWLANLGDQSRWSKHKFNTSLKCDVNNTNFVESFNSTLGVDRCRPILTFLEGIRKVSMVRMATRRENCEKWERTNTCPNI
ncbi:RNA-directed RNA polymerase L, partial [Bienertia sinuspersici]